MCDTSGLEPDEAYLRSVEGHQRFKDEIHRLLAANYKGVARDIPNGRHNLEFSFEEDFFGFTRRWVVVTQSGQHPLAFERATRFVGIYKDDLENGVIDGVLIVTESGADKFARDFFAQNAGFLHRTIADLQKQRPITEAVAPLDHEAAAYRDVVEKVEATKEAIRGENGEEMPFSVKKRIITELEAGLMLLRADEIRLELVVEVMIKALRFIVSKLANSATGMIAGAAVVALSHLFGIR